MFNKIKNLLKKDNGIGLPDNRPHDPIDFANWTIKFNYPFGFIVQNKKTDEEYHFFCESDGWITSKHRAGKKDAILAYSTRSLLSGQFYPSTQLVDEKSTKKWSRIMVLQRKGDDLTPEEKDELLELTGVLKNKN